MLTDCPECHGQVSTEAEACPHCGYPVQGREFLIKCPSCQNTVFPENLNDPYRANECPICGELTEKLKGLPLLVWRVAVFIFIAGISTILLAILLS